MAITGNYSTSTGVNLNLVAYYSYTQDTSSNTSSVTVTLKLRRRSFKGDALTGSYLSVNGQKSTYTYSKYTSDTTSVEDTLATKTVTIQHNNTTGKASCPIKGTFVFNGIYGGKYIGTLTIDKTLVLNTIQRASTFSVPTSINTGSNLTVTINPTNSSFKHRVQCSVNGVVKYEIDLPAGTNSTSCKVEHSWIPNDTSGDIAVYVHTYQSNGTSIAGLTKYVTANVPSNIIPKISSVTATVVNGLNSRYVQGKSKVKISVSADAGDGSTINSYTIKGESLSYTGSSSTATSGIVSGIGTFEYTVTVLDKRGRPSAQKTVSITIYPYTTPRIVAMTVQRCSSDGIPSNEGTYAKVSVDVVYSPIDGQNTLIVNLSNSKDNYETTRTVLTQNSGTTTYSGVYGSEFLTSENYIIQSTIRDYYTTGLPMSATLKVSTRPFNMAKYGNGMAFGGFSSVTNQEDKGLFECYWDTNINANEAITGNLTVNGSTTLNNLAVNGSLTASDSYRIKYQTIPSGADLNDEIYRVPGFYRSTSSTNSITNKPSEMNNGAFELVVTGIAESSYCTQTVKDISSNIFYVRTQTAWSGDSNFPSWTEWSRILTSDIPANKYYPNYGINMNNSDLIGANSIYFADKCDSTDGGINFVRYDGGYDVFYAVDGGLFLRKNQSASPIRAWANDMLDIRRGTCTLNVSNATTVNFSSALPGVPTVMLTPLTSNSGVIAAKVHSVTASGFTAIISGSGINDTQFAYLAVWTLQS